MSHALIKGKERFKDRTENESGKSVLLNVEGMCCPDEAELLEKKLKGLNGIRDFDINITSQKVRIEYDPALVSIQEVIKSIAETGMKACLERRENERKRPWYLESKVLFISVCTFLTLTTLSLERLFGLSHQVARVIYGVAIAIGIYYPVKIALAALRVWSFNINTLLVVAAAGAVGLGLWDEAAVLVFVYTWGSILEAYAVDRSRSALKALIELSPKEALVKRDDLEITLPVEEIQVGNVIIIRPGEKIPMDGRVLAGNSSVDQSSITGEPMPVRKAEGDEVFAGSLNQRGSLEVTVTKLFKDTTLARIIHSVEEAQGKKTKYQRFGERFGKLYTPAMFSLALGVMLFPPLIIGGPWEPWFYRGLVVFVVSCSCGLALSVPVSVVTAIGNAARHGILFKGGAYLEAASQLETVVFDKTGTLTIGRPSVTDVVSLNGSSRETLLSIAASIESRSEHPLAEAILRAAREMGIPVKGVEDFESIPGRGVRARLNGDLYYIGSRRLFGELGASITEAEETLARMEAQGKTVVLLGKGERVLGVIGVADQLRKEAGEVIKALKRQGIKRVVMLTGDNEGTAKAIAREAGVDEYLAQLLPEDKVKAVEGLRQRFGRIAMVGDGVNDAPAMAVADIGIAMGTVVTDVAIETGDLVLMSDDLSKIPYALYLSRRAMRNIRQNIIASLAIVTFLVPAALIGWVSLVPGLLINETSALIVISNGLRLLK